MFLLCLLAWWFVSGCSAMDDLLYTLALTKRLGKQANIARARDVKLCTSGCLGMQILASMQGGQCSQK